MDASPQGIALREKTEQALLTLAAQWQAYDILTPEAKNEFWPKQFAKCIKCLGCVNACPVEIPLPTFFQQSSVDLIKSA